MKQSDSLLPNRVAAVSPQETLHQRLWRLGMMVGVILTGVVGLAAIAAYLGWDAQQQQMRALSAERLSQEQLWESYLKQASAVRVQGLQGRRMEGLAALQKAAAGWLTLHEAEADDSPNRLRLRNEAAALLALPDIVVSRPPVALPEKQSLLAIDGAQGLLATFLPIQGITIRRMSDGAVIARPLPGPTFSNAKAVTSLAWRPAVKDSADHTWLCAFFQNGEVAMWQMPEAKLCYEYHPPEGTSVLGGGPAPGLFSPDGRYLTFFPGESSPLTIIDLEDYQAVPHHLEQGRRALAIRPGTSETATARSGFVDLIDFQTGIKIKTWPISSPIQTLAWSPDGKWLAGMAWTGEVHIWGLEKQAAWAMTGHSAPCRTLAFSPDSETLMSSSMDGTTSWWSPESGALLLTSQTGKGLTYNKTGSAIVFENNTGGLGEWEVQSSQVQQTVTVPGELNVSTAYMDLSPDGQWLLASTPEGPLLCSTALSDLPMSGRFPMTNHYIFDATGRVLTFEGNQIVRKSVTVGADNQLLLTQGEALQVRLPEGERPRKMMLSADGRSVLLEFTSLLCGLADLQGERPFLPFNRKLDRLYIKAPASATGAGRFAMSPDGRYAAFAYGMRSTGPAFNALVFSTENCTELHAPRFNSGCTQFSPDSQQVIFCVDGAALILRASDGKELVRRPLAGHLAISSALASSANGILTALAITPQFMQLCRSGDLSPIISLTSPLPGNVRSCRIAQDGSRLATLYTGNKIILWDVRALRHQLGLLGLDWRDSATTPQVVGSPVAVSTVSRWGLAFWLFAAAIVAAVTSVLLLRRQHQLMRDFAEAEALLDTQRRDLEQANSSLLHSQKMKALGTLAAGMAHDFNNMLSVIRMSNKLIARETRGNTEVTELVASVESAVLQGKQVVRSMLSYSRAEDDHAPHRPIAVVVQDAAALFSTEFLSGITLKMSLDERAPEVDVSNSSIQQILLNLIVNASEAMKGTGSLTITVRRATALDTAICVLPPQRAAEYVEICVTDTGPGIPNDIAERIFEPFFTTKNAGNDRGTGLGLSMVYTIAEREGMGLALRSIVGQGAAFYLFLPVCTVRESHTEIHTSTA